MPGGEIEHRGNKPGFNVSNQNTIHICCDHMPSQQIMIIAFEISVSMRHSGTVKGR
jgi:hypothetical protein